MRTTLFAATLLFGACGSDDPVDIVLVDAGFERSPNQPNPAGDAGEDNRPLRPDVGLTIPDANSLDWDAGEAMDAAEPPLLDDAGTPDPQDAGQAAIIDGGAPGPEEPRERQARLLQQRRFLCDGEELSTASFTWEGGQLTRIQHNEVGFPVFDWRITHEQGRPTRAQSNLDGWSLEARWTYRNDRLESAFMGDPEETLEWRFEYDDSDRPIAMARTEVFEGQISTDRSEAVWRPDGPEDFFGTALSYNNGRPSEVNGTLPVLYNENGVLRGVGGGAFTLRYGADGALAELDLLDGCLYRFTWAAGEPEHFQGSLGLGDFAMLYDVEGRYVGDFDPASELYLVILLLLGE